jgi:hypothetical protein
MGKNGEGKDKRWGSLKGRKKYFIFIMHLEDYKKTGDPSTSPHPSIRQWHFQQMDWSSFLHAPVSSFITLTWSASVSRHQPKVKTIHAPFSFPPLLWERAKALLRFISWEA